LSDNKADVLFLNDLLKAGAWCSKKIQLSIIALHPYCRGEKGAQPGSASLCEGLYKLKSSHSSALFLTEVFATFERSLLKM